MFDVVGSVATYALVFTMASCRSSSLTMLYLSDTARVRCPLIFIATAGSTPARTMFRRALRRESYRIRKGANDRLAGARSSVMASPAAWQAVAPVRAPAR
jgi:hypothetical protein